MQYTKDLQNWPLVIFNIKGQIDEKFNDFLKDWSELYVKSSNEKSRFRLIINIKEIGKVDMKYIIGIGQFLKKCKILTETWMERTAILVKENSFIKTALNTVFMIYKPVRPFKIFTNPEDAIKWTLSDESGDKTF